MRIPLIALLLQGIPEQIAVTTLAFVIAGIPLKWNRVLLIGVVLAFLAYLVRLFPIPFGIHTIILIFVLFSILSWFTKGDIGLSFIASTSSLLALGIFEFSSMLLIMQIFGFTPETFFNDLVIRSVVGEMQVLLLFVFAFLLPKLYIRKVV